MDKTVIIGRKGHIRINDKSVSRHHAKLTISGSEIHIKDLYSTNGIFIIKNKRMIQIYNAFLQPNQVIVIGRCKYKVADLIGAINYDAA